MSNWEYVLEALAELPDEIQRGLRFILEVVHFGGGRMNENTESSLFGVGLAYSLGLFISHEWLRPQTPDSPKPPGHDPIARPDLWFNWFNGAGDHLTDLQIDHAPEHLRPRLGRLQGKVLDWRLMEFSCDKPTYADVKWAIEEAKELLRLIDEAAGIPTIRGDCR